MSAVCESVSTVAWENNGAGDTLILPKPTGLAVGDMLIAHLSEVSDNDSNIPSGWSDPELDGWALVGSDTVTSGGQRYGQMTVYWKIADADDVAASNFTFTHAGNNGDWNAGALYRISGHGGILAGTFDDSPTGSSVTFTNTGTPIVEENLLLFLVSVTSADPVTVSTYAIASDNPTWSEKYDFTAFFSSRDGAMSGATALRTSLNATGNSSCTLSGSACSIGAMLIIPSAVGADGTHDLLEMGPSEVFDSENTAGTTASHELLEMPASEVFEPSGEVVERRWTDEEKGTGVWNNEIKT